MVARYTAHQRDMQRDRKGQRQKETETETGGEKAAAGADIREETERDKKATNSTLNEPRYLSWHLSLSL